MSSTEPENNGRSRDDIIAGEFVLGVLSAQDRATVQARIRTDSAFAKKVSHWEQHFSSLNDDYAEATPPSHLFMNIEKRLFEGSAPAKSGLWSSLAFWRSLSLASLALVAGIGLLQLGVFNLQPASKPLVAQLTSENGDINLVALYDDQSGIVKLTPAAAGKPEEKSLELWLIDGDKPAVSLGVLPSSGNGEVKIPPAFQNKISEGMIFAISLEPFGGSPTGKATGPVLAVGKAQSL